MPLLQETTCRVAVATRATARAVLTTTARAKPCCLRPEQGKRDGHYLPTTKTQRPRASASQRDGPPRKHDRGGSREGATQSATQSLDDRSKSDGPAKCVLGAPGGRHWRHKKRTKTAFTSQAGVQRGGGLVRPRASKSQHM